MESAEAIRRHHVALAQQLRDLRINAGLSGHDLASLLNWSQSRVSRLETARQRPTVEEIEQLGAALELPKASIKQLLRDLASLEDEWNSFRDLQFGGSHNGQAEVQKIEQSTVELRFFERTLIPGLLQTPAYTRSLCEITEQFETEDDIDEVVNLRAERQQLLDDQTRRFQFVVTDSALTTRYAPSTVMAEQYEYLIDQTRRPNVRLGIITRWTPMPFIPHSSFQIYDQALVTVDTSNGQLVLRHRTDITEHTERFLKAKQIAVAGADAREILKELADRLM